MPLKFNPVTAQLDLVEGSSSGVQNLGTSSDNAIARFDGVTGQFVQNSIPSIQDGGTIEASAFSFQRTIDEDIEIRDGRTWVASGLSIESGSLTIESDGEVVIL
jgi:hypothetical protein